MSKKLLPLLTLAFFLTALLTFGLLGLTPPDSAGEQDSSKEVIIVSLFLLFSLAFCVTLLVWAGRVVINKLSENQYSPRENFEGTEGDLNDRDESNRRSWAKKGGILAVILLFLGKVKGLLFPVLFLLKKALIILKLSKFGGTIVSMGLMIWVYALIYGWKFALGLVLLLFFHENGHLWFAKLKGLPVSLPIFIPFMGAFIAMKEEPKDAATEAFIAIGGPLVGGLTALLCWGLYLATGYPLWAALGYMGFFLNLFNLIPAHPLDGGRVVTVLSPMLWLAGIAILAVLTFFRFNPLLLLILIMAATRCWKARKETKEGSAYFQVDRETRIRWTIAYFSLAGVLGYLMIHSLHVLEGIRGMTILS